MMNSDSYFTTASSASSSIDFAEPISKKMIRAKQIFFFYNMGQYKQGEYKYIYRHNIWNKGLNCIDGLVR